jgi:hypothetical protein
MDMRIQGLIILLIATVVLGSLLGSCGGGTGIPQDLQEAAELNQDLVVSETASENLDGSPADVSGLPALPEGLEPGKGSSAVGDGAAPSVRGNDYINAANATETDSGLLLQPPGFGLAWALYGIEGLNDYDVTGLDVQASQLEDAGGYFVAVGNYSNRSWTISGPHVAAARVRLPEDASYISPAGTLYFVVFTLDPAGTLMQSASAILDRETDRPMRRSHAPWGLEASDGTTEGGIALHWNAPRRGEVEGYVIMRRLQPGEAVGEHDLEVRGFVAIGRTAETRFFDDNARPDTRYFYSVVARNDAGRSAHSNVDGGWWGDARPDVHPFLAGIVTSEDGRPVPGVSVGIADGGDRARVLTNDNGKFVLRNLRDGIYFLHAETGNDRTIALPETIRVEIAGEPVRGIHFIVKRAGAGTDDGGDDDPIVE